MATGTRICKVCGREYEYCHTARRVADVFRYQDVACCPEHGQVYLAEVLASRGQEDTAVTPKNNKAKAKIKEADAEKKVYEETCKETSEQNDNEVISE